MHPAVRRWLIVAALFAVTYGVSTPLAAYGVFLPILADTFAWSRGALSAALSVNLVLGGIAGFAIGALTDRLGPRLMLLMTVPLAGAGFALVSTVQTQGQLYCYVGVLGGVGLSSFYLIGASTVTHWFHDRRGLPIALVLVGFNLGYISAGPLAAWLIPRLGWRGAYALLGGGCGLLSLLAALSVRLPNAAESAALHRPSRLASATGIATTGVASRPSRGRGATLHEVLTDPRQWYLNIAWLSLGCLTLMVSVHIVPFARDRGIGFAGAALALTAYGIGSVSGRITAGLVSDWLGALPTIRVAYAIQALALLALWWLPSREALLACLAAFGIGFAAADTMVVKVIPDVFGVHAIGAVMGVLSLGWRSGAAVGPALAGWLYDVTGSYTIPFTAAPCMVVISWTFFALATSRR